jgi:hypothetical protein
MIKKIPFMMSFVEAFCVFSNLLVSQSRAGT